MDNDIAIRTEGLGKRYRLGQTVDLSRTFREVIMGLPQMFHHHARKALRSPASDPEHPDTRGGYFWALRDIDLEIKHGETLGIIGRNGAGKSTLLKVLSRITAPTVGTADIYGRIGSLLEVGTGFHPELTGRENIYLNGAILGMRKTEIDARFDEIVQFAQTEQFLDTPVKRYSNGMRVRLAFAVAAHLDTEILIVDEVLSVGDAEFRKRCLGKMSDVTKQGRTVLFVSHNMAAIQNLCNRIILLDDGRLTMDGAAQEVVEHYLASTNMEETTVDVDIEHHPREKGHGEMLKMTGCHLTTERGEKTACLRFGQPFTVQLETRHLRKNEIRGVDVVIGIDGPDHVRLASCSSEECRVTYTSTPEEPVKISASIPEPLLTPGIYYLTLVLRTGKVVIDRVPQCLRFEVLDVPEPGKYLTHWLAGHMRIAAKWEGETR